MRMSTVAIIAMTLMLSACGSVKTAYLKPGVELDSYRSELTRCDTTARTVARGGSVPGYMPPTGNAATAGAAGFAGGLMQGWAEAETASKVRKQCMEGNGYKLITLTEAEQAKVNAISSKDDQARYLLTLATEERVGAAEAAK